MEIQYIRVGDYFIPDLVLPEEPRSIGKWGRMHRDYLREYNMDLETLLQSFRE